MDLMPLHSVIPARWFSRIRTNLKDAPIFPKPQFPILSVQIRVEEKVCITIVAIGFSSFYLHQLTVMKSLLLILLFPLLFLGKNTTERQEPTASLMAVACQPEATCYGNNPCNACKTCNYCKHCNSGGSCGVCAPATKRKETKQLPSTTQQCRAITKKGVRCKRSAGGGGYCWQHG